ncbi:hypothetical protein BGZ99_006661, partial [Dissophora globulifera]
MSKDQAVIVSDSAATQDDQDYCLVKSINFFREFKSFAILSKDMPGAIELFVREPIGADYAADDRILMDVVSGNDWTRRSFSQKMLSP